MVLTPLELVFSAQELERLARELQPSTLDLIRKYVRQSHLAHHAALCEIGSPVDYAVAVKAAATATEMLSNFCDLVEALHAEEAERQARSAPSAGKADPGRKP